MMRDLGILGISVEVSTKYSTASTKIRELLTTIREVAKDRNDRGQAEASFRTRVVTIGALVAIILGGTIGYLLARFFSRGVIHIAKVAEQAAAGNLQARASMESEDELGHMATAFNQMLDRITALVQTEEDRDVMQRRLKEFLTLVSDVGKGDLTKRGEVTADMFGNLADAFNLMLERFGKLMRQTREADERVNQSAASLRENSGQMASTAKHQVEESTRKLAESSTQATREIADLVKMIQTETQDAVVAMEHETQAVEAGSASALRTGQVFEEISQIAQRSAGLAQSIANSAAEQTASTDKVGRALKDFAGGAVATQKATDTTRVTVEEMAKLAQGLNASVAQFKVA